ncbi:thioredoxin family protein [Virgibacillus sp. MSP4-1]|uniref:Thioredoxin family protein n=1 Tax=Salinibacillus aidingensis TaxID=237684 RepID=A0ABP3L0V3_9BACI|nr:thioredoxin family protein [Virgibacillus sp. MSP4-1]QHS21623.1 thioredoxin family protein [Virgibacillus sp. MSP4-1]
MKKIFIIGGIIVVLFGALIAVVQYQNNDLYGNQIKPDELQQSLDNGEDKTIYFYSPECPHCKKATPIVVPLTEDLGINMEKVNVLEYEEALRQFKIEYTPTIVRYEDGEEVKRFVGAAEEEKYRTFFEQNVLDE